MFCEILHTLYVKSNGLVVCNDDFGEAVELGMVDTESTDWDIVANLFENSRYAEIRAGFSNGRLPWPDVCSKCSLLRRDDVYVDRLRRKHIIRLQFEVSLACNLRCPYCSNHVQVRSKTGPHIMPLKTFETVLQSLKRRDFRLDMIEYLGQGDPLMNRDFQRFVRRGRELFPKAKQRLVTNGNFDYQNTVGDVHLDEVVVSCDGLFQDNYVKYRVGGRVDKVLQFIQDAGRAARNGPSRTTVVWKYILFEWTDSDREILATQELADRLPIDKLWFIFTHSLGKSVRFLPEDPFAIPVTSHKVQFHNTCAIDLLLDRATLGPSNFDAGALVEEPFFAYLEEITLYKNKLLRIAGWIAAYDPPVSRLDFYLNGRLLGSVEKFLWRDDVFEVFPRFPEQDTAFRLSVDAAEIPLLDRYHSLRIIAFKNDQLLGAYEHYFQMKSDGAAIPSRREARLAVSELSHALSRGLPAPKLIEKSPRLAAVLSKLYRRQLLRALAFLAHIEEISVSAGRFLKVRGWILSHRPPVSRLEIYLNGRHLGTVTEPKWRPDTVASLCHIFADQRSSFRFVTDLGEDLEDGPHELSITPYDASGALESFTQPFHLSSEPAELALVTAG